jgi:hypothetical protein
MGAEVLPGEKTPVGMRQGGATTAQEPRLALVARSEAMHGWRVFRIASASLWGHRGSQRGQTRAVRSENARDYGTEVGRAGAASPPVWPVHSRGALVAHAWLCSFDLSKFDECTNLAPSSIRKRWTVWFMTSRLVAERVSFGTALHRQHWTDCRLLSNVDRSIYRGL